MRRTLIHSMIPAAALLWFATATGHAGPAAVFRNAEAGYRFQFPRDLRPRHGYRTSWWYYTGHLYPEDAGEIDAKHPDRRHAGRRFGFQFTIFKIENTPNPTGDYRAGNVFYMAHLALTDEENRKYYFSERLQRHFPGMAGYDRGRRTVYVENNTLRIDDSGREHSIRMRADDFRLDLNLATRLGPLVHGERGISRKGYAKSSASHYFSIPDLSGGATLKIGAGPARRLFAKSWMDVEFGSNVLSKSQTGWDWLHVSLEDGRRYMVFRVRDSQGRDFYSASIIDASGRIRSASENQIRMQAGRVWSSAATGADYPVEWNVQVEDTLLEIKPWLDHQEAHPEARDGSQVSYWEGAVDVLARPANDSETKGGKTGTNGPTPVRGVGYIEMTGYANSMGGTL